MAPPAYAEASLQGPGGLRLVFDLLASLFHFLAGLLGAAFGHHCAAVTAEGMSSPCPDGIAALVGRGITTEPSEATSPAPGLAPQ